MHSACAALGVLSLAGPALAAEEDAGTVLPEVVVTAERRVQNLQELPISATVVSGEQLAQRGVSSIADVQRIAPSLAINTYNRSTFINIRGIGIAQSAPTSTPGVAYYINGALIPHEQTISMSFYDLESVQVLRGPQGTLTGQNSTGGAVYVTTPKPKLGDLFGYVDQTFSNYAGSRTIGAINLPIGPMFAMRVGGIIDKRDSFTTNVASPSQPGDINVAAIRGDLAFTPNDTWTANLRYEKFRNHTDYNAVKRRNDTVSTDPFSIQEDAISNFLQDGYRSELEARVNLTSEVLLRTEVNYQYGINVDQADGDRTATATVGPPQNGRIGYARTIFNTLIGEVDLISQGDGPLQWVAGAFSLREHVPVELLTFGNDRVTPAHAPTRTTRTEAINLSNSVFGQVDYRFNQNWEVMAGARYSDDKQTYHRIVPAAVTGVAKSDNWTGRLALNYHLNDDTMFYGSVARGYKAGGVNLGASDPPFDPETNVVEELGFKTTVMDGHLRLNGAVFASQYNDLQLSSLTAPPPAGTPTTHNVPKSKSDGAELEVTGIWGNFQVNGGIAYLNAKTDSDAALSNNTGIGATFQTVPSGTGLPFSPRITGNAGVQYDFDVGKGRLTPRLQVSYLSEQYASVFRNANSLVPEHTLLDARLSYDSTGLWRAEAFVNNLTDKTYIASQVQDSSSTNGGIIYGAPRTYGVRLVVKFD